MSRNSREEIERIKLVAAKMPVHTGSEILCILVGADMTDRTVTIKLPHGLTPGGLEIGQPFFVSYPFYSSKHETQT